MFPNDSQQDADELSLRLERMRSEFVDAQRRRATPAEPAAPPNHADDGPLIVGHADATLTGIAAERRS